MFFIPGAVQSEDLLATEKEEEKSTKEPDLRQRGSSKPRSRHNSDEYRKRREERERQRRIREEEERRRRRERAREAEERRRQEDRERRERKRQEEKEAEKDRLVGKGKTLPDQPSVIRLGGKAKCEYFLVVLKCDYDAVL